MKPCLKPEILRYVRRNRKRYFCDENGMFQRKKCGIDYRTFCRALNLLPVEIDTAFSVLEILEVPPENMPGFIDWK